jgi:hypothetical protein
MAGQALVKKPLQYAVKLRKFNSMATLNVSSADLKFRLRRRSKDIRGWVAV